MQHLREILEYLGGERDDAQGVPSILQFVVTRCLLWIVLTLLIYAFSGQSSKFIYIDF